MNFFDNFLIVGNLSKFNYTFHVLLISHQRISTPIVRLVLNSENLDKFKLEFLITVVYSNSM